MVLVVPYMIPLFLGMTYNARYSKPGVDIFDLKYVDDPEKTDFKESDCIYTVVESERDVQDGLDISPDRALQIKLGNIKVDGIGSYYTNVGDRGNKIEILTRCSYNASVQSLKADAQPRERWMDQYSRQVLGTHYVSSITYGVQMIGSLLFEVYNNSDVEDVKGAVRAALKTRGKGIDLAAEGKLESLVKKLSNKTHLEVSYYGTLPLNSIGNDVDSFRHLVLTFQEQVEAANMGEGIPMEVFLTPLADIADEEHREDFQFTKNEELTKEMADMDQNMTDVREAKKRLVAWVKALPFHIEEQYEKEVGRLIRNMTEVLQVFQDVLWKMDLTQGPEQLQPARDAYSYGGRCRDLVEELIQRMNSLIKRGEVAGDSYIQWGNSNCTAANTQVLYEGFVISSVEEGIGGVAQYECAPKSPEKGYDLDDVGVVSRLAGIRYTKLGEETNPFLGEHAADISGKGVACAKCYSPDSASVVTFSALENCPLTWERMYTGYLMSTRVGGHTTEYVCVDDTPVSTYPMEDEDDDRDTLALTIVHSSGSLPDAKYVNGALVRCSVCAMKSNQISL